MSTPPAVPRWAATVVLLRDDPLRVFLQRRVAGMAFAANMAVFPGGGVDPTDLPDPVLWTGPGPDRWARRLGCTPAEAGALVHAAVRETFEECGVLLAGPGTVTGLDAARDDLVAHRVTLGSVLAAAGLRLRADLLAPWSRWVTPEGEPRRYDAAILVARLPAGQEADARTTEAVEARWWRPAEALDALRMLPPTRHTLEEIAEHPDAASVLAAAADRVVRTHRPVLHREGGRLVVTDPADPRIRADLGPAV